MKRIRVIFIGHNSPEFLERQRVYRRSFASQHIEIETASIQGGPETIEQDFDEIRSSPFILDEVLKAEAEGVDAVVIDCALDPCLSGLRESVRIPLIGAGQSAFILASALGTAWSILSPLARLIPGLRRRIESYGFTDRVVSFRCLDTEILDLLSEDALKAFIEQGEKAVVGDGADVLILGCTGMSPAVPHLAKRFSVPLVDPAASAICLAETLLRLGVSHSSACYPLKESGNRRPD